MFTNMQGNAKKYLTSKLVPIQEKQHNSLFQKPFLNALACL